METIKPNPLLLLPPGAIEYIRKIHNLDKPERMVEAINILEEWIQKQDHLIKKDFSRRYLDATIITCKGSVEKAKKQIDSLCTMRTLLPKFFTTLNIKEQLKESMENLAWIVPLPRVTEDYYRIVACKFYTKDITAETLMHYFQYNIILCEYIKANDYVNGFIVLFDISEVNLVEVMTKINMTQLQQFLSIIIEGYGARLKAIHLITESKAIDLFVKMLKNFLSEKIGNRIYVHPNSEDIQKVIPKEILPLEYGGYERSILKMNEEWIDELSSEKHAEYMKMMSKACTDEAKRTAGKFNEEYMGMPGSFRILSVD